MNGAVSPLKYSCGVHKIAHSLIRPNGSSNYNPVHDSDNLCDDDKEEENIDEHLPAVKNSLIITPAIYLLPGNILEECEKWVNNQWSLSSLPIVRIINNPAIHERNILSQKFYLALKDHDITVNEGSYVLGWHGTFEHNIKPICTNGFDPSMRQGQQYGVGEYFGTNCGISHGYCKGGYFMLVVLLLRGCWLTEQPGSSYIVKNPLPDNKTYCLPLMIVNFGSERPSPF